MPQARLVSLRCRWRDVRRYGTRGIAEGAGEQIGTEPERRIALPRRLSKFVAACGFRRRDAEQFIRDGRITVDQAVITNAGELVDAESAMVALDGSRVLRPQRPRLFIYHKARDEVVERKRPRPDILTVYESIYGQANRKLDIPKNLLPVGRMDASSEGLLLLTTSSKLAAHLTDPSNAYERVYLVNVNGTIDMEKLNALRAGVTAPDSVTFQALRIQIRYKGPTTALLKITLRDGKNAKVNAALEWAGLRPYRTTRTQFGPFELDNPQTSRRAVVEVPIPGFLRGFT
ncbi:unnamed protein product (mitochondrion) [Plasmodiophora brassicae]|uniref:RNA-binding S4 domain-containing protein n=1 Tax=Plasmodiophora brassicae TaxID=37360 RepID=A0A0G4IWB4_PLABS|nr:hypothetical protein PBRA_001272 [Plasmodiophora brassicae]SPQ97376.1 unnamed protein product [Plasmodiophora brassicae]